MYITTYLSMSSYPTVTQELAHRNRTIHILNIPLFHQYLFRLQTDILDYMFWYCLASFQLFYLPVDVSEGIGGGGGPTCRGRTTWFRLSWGCSVFRLFFGMLGLIIYFFSVGLWMRLAILVCDIDVW